MPELIIVRGLPGSGKSTFVKNYMSTHSSTNYIHFEADQFFIRNGEYKFDGSLIKKAHEWCFYNVLQALQNGNNVIVSNTFVARWEMAKYLEIVGYVPVNITIINIRSQYQNIHDVPNEVVQKMKSRWEEVDPAWDVKVFDAGEIT